MTDYSTPQIEAFSLLILFIFLFIYKVMRWIHTLRNKTLLAKNRTLKKLKKLSWDDFEKLCMELFEKEGWKVRGNEKKGADGGVDIWMSKSYLIQKNVSAIVQCKRYDDAIVTIKVLREMYGLMHEHEVDKAYIVTTSRFTKECYTFSKNKSIILIDGTYLLKLILNN